MNESMNHNYSPTWCNVRLQVRFSCLSEIVQHLLATLSLSLRERARAISTCDFCCINSTNARGVLVLVTLDFPDILVKVLDISSLLNLGKWWEDIHLRIDTSTCTWYLY